MATMDDAPLSIDEHARCSVPPSFPYKLNPRTSPLMSPNPIRAFTTSNAANHRCHCRRSSSNHLRLSPSKFRPGKPVPVKLRPPPPSLAVVGHPRSLPVVCDPLEEQVQEPIYVDFQNPDFEVLE